MHEVSLCQGIVELLQEKAEVESFSCIQSIRLEIGLLSCVEAEAMRFAFDAVAAGTVAQGAKLEIDEVPGLGWCSRCASEVRIDHRYDACPNCESYPLEIRQGDEMRIKYVEVV
ncbi:Hydrogenase-3 nickel incorporation protein HypA [Mariprofundus ferrinatatus]|uniref:Hydrogenase maturation factor HypA n=1 Tax=Mariprofundus ferrinatatus TaxID=1921087 RepID=A0A2K8L3Q2_9PROT|nr:hydrogenase maturation nickel metallochaperone HypA [Mariprofundus ferrinatatus]ATX81732.1 Hydrogenase-3 nickel incorporation protein HypA [Mariprofundus ferrinatatus]